MVPLQAAPPLGPPLTVLGVAVVGGIGLGAVGNAAVRRLSNPVAKYRALYTGLILPFAVLVLLALETLGFGAGVAAWLGLAPDGPLGTLIGHAVAACGAGLAGVAAYAPTIRGVRAVRDLDLSTGRSVLRMSRYALAVALLYAVLRVGLRAGRDSALFVPAVVAGLVFGTVAAAPWLVGALQSTRRPDDETAAHLDRLCERAGLDVRDTRLLDRDAEGTAELVVRGVGPTRRLFVSSRFREVFDDGTATALLAVQAGRVRARRLPKFAGTAGLALVAATAGLDTDGLFWASFGAAVGLLLAACWVGRRTLRAADDYAADAVGPDRVADALRRYATVHDLDPTRRRFPNPLSPRVPLGDRIDRLRKRGE